MGKNALKKSLLFTTFLCVAFISNVYAQADPKTNNNLNRITSLNTNWQPGGIFFGEFSEKETLAARTENTKRVKSVSSVSTRYMNEEKGSFILLR